MAAALRGERGAGAHPLFDVTTFSLPLSEVHASRKPCQWVRYCWPPVSRSSSSATPGLYESCGQPAGGAGRPGFAWWRAAIALYPPPTRSHALTQKKPYFWVFQQL